MSKVIEPPKDHAERVERLRLVLKTIEDNPQHWKQSRWHCGTSHCFAGFAQCIALGMSHTVPVETVEGGLCAVVQGEERDVEDDAVEWLGLADVELEDDDWYPVSASEVLFDGSNTLADLRRIVDEIADNPAARSADAREGA